MGRIERLWSKLSHKGPMDEAAALVFVEGHGVLGAGSDGEREITIITSESWAVACATLGQKVDPVARRANVMISGIDLAESTGRMLRLGGAIVEICGETTPCAGLDRNVPGLCAALTPPWTGGAFGRVIEGGQVRTDDEAAWE